MAGFSGVLFPDKSRRLGGMKNTELGSENIGNIENRSSPYLV